MFNNSSELHNDVRWSEQEAIRAAFCFLNSGILLTRGVAHRHCFTYTGADVAFFLSSSLHRGHVILLSWAGRRSVN